MTYQAMNKGRKDDHLIIIRLDDEHKDTMQVYYSLLPFIRYLTIFNVVAEVLGAKTCSDGRPGVLLGPGQGAGGHRGDGVIRMAKENTGRETLSIRS